LDSSGVHVEGLSGRAEVHAQQRQSIDIVSTDVFSLSTTEVSVAAELRAGEAGGKLKVASRIHAVAKLGTHPSVSALGAPHDLSEISLDLGIRVESGVGLAFDGSGDLELSIPASIAVLPGISIESLSVRLKLAEEIQASLSVALRLTLGPVELRVKDLGATANLSLGTGNLGFGDLDFTARPPDGIGVSVSAGPVTGGGFISYEDSTGRYIGALALDISGIGLKAFGVLETRAPGVEGYSFLIVITAEFTPVQLGFGFTLNGVGGLCGIQRSVSVEALQSGVRDGSLAPLLFARDPVAQASRLVAAVSRVFPATADRYVFGPLFKLGWGSPTLVTIVLGVVIQLPAPVIIVLLGQISAAFPKPEAPVVVLNIDVVGVLDTGEKRLSVDASLRDSRILGWTLTGDMAFRLNWGAQADFLLSVGGFHKDFHPPANFPTLRRLSLALGSGSNPRISLEAYLAVTSNTFQVGARAEAYVEALGFNVHGYLTFDALFIFSPFSFRIGISAGLAIRMGSTSLASVSVAGTIAGPTPWQIDAEASISILFFDVTIPVHARFGDAGHEEARPTVEPWDKLREALLDVRNWSGELPAGRSRGVTLASPAPQAPLRLDPLGRLRVRQQVLPLARRLTKLGEGRIAAPMRFDLTAIAPHGVAGLTGDQLRPVEEPFAAGQYEALSDQEKLSRPSFEPMAAGVELTSGTLPPGLGAGVLHVRSVVTVRARRRSGSPTLPAPSDRMVATALLGRPGVGAPGGVRRYLPAPDASPRVTLGPEQWALVSRTDLSGVGGLASSAAYGAVSETLRQHALAEGGGTGQWMVAPAFERRG
jgi:hypothetical protein